jgi:hypothetical protein
MRFGEGMQPGTVEWELNQRRRRAQQREDDRHWAEIQATREAEGKDLRTRLAAFLDRFTVRFHDS